MITGTPGEKVITGTDANGVATEFRLRRSWSIAGHDGSDYAHFYIYDIFESGAQVHAMRLGISSEGHPPIWVDMVPSAFEDLAEWLFKEATELRPGDRS